MLLRLALVGTVAALGVTLPSQARCRQWFDAAQDWASGVLADWDTWQPGAINSDRASNANGELDCPRRQLAQAQQSVDPVTAARSATVSKAAVVGPIGVALLTIPIPCVLLPSDSDCPVNIAVVSEPATVGAFEATFAEQFEPIDASDDVAACVLAELCRAAVTAPLAIQAEPAWPNVSNEEDPDGAGPFGCSLYEFAAGQGNALASLAPGNEIMPEAVIPGFWRFEPDVCGTMPEVLDGDREAAVAARPEMVNDRESIERTGALAGPRSALAELPADLFGPSPGNTVAELPYDVFGPSPAIDSPRIELEQRTALALRDLPSEVFGAPEVCHRPSGEVVQTGPEHRAGRGVDGPRLGHAFMLTREALFAWVHVFTGPAAVDVASRTDEVPRPSRTARKTDVEAFQ